MSAPVARQMVFQEAVDAAVDRDLLAKVLAHCDDLRFGSQARWERTLRLAESIQAGRTCRTCYGMGAIRNGVMYCGCEP